MRKIGLSVRFPHMDLTRLECCCFIIFIVEKSLACVLSSFSLIFL